MRIIGVIPARLASTRFPGKPLVPILGLPMIGHVFHRCRMNLLLEQVYIATCDREIANYAESIGARSVMTALTHQRAVDRTAEALLLIECQTARQVDIVVMIQGDEPLVLPAMIEEVVRPLLDDDSLPASNLIARIIDAQEFDNPNVPKVVANRQGDILYISREPIPSRHKAGTQDYAKWKQLGIIAFRREFLQRFAELSPTPLEQIESVDMMRAVEHGYRVCTVKTSGALIGVDVPQDIQRVEQALRSDSLVHRYVGEAALTGRFGNR